MAGLTFHAADAILDVRRNPKTKKVIETTMAIGEEGGENAMTISDLTCVSEKGNRLYGAAAVSYRLFHQEETYPEAKRRADQLALRKLIKECGYGYFDEEDL